MVQVKTVTNDLLALANKGSGLDIDGMWGMQCVDLTNGVTTLYFGKSLWGNAIDLLDSAKAQGFNVVYEAVGVIPKEGWLFVMHAIADGVDYGHTGYIYKDSDGYTLDTIEQNINGYSDNNFDGVNDQLQVGGQARINQRNFDNIVGYIVPDYEQIQEVVVTKNQEGDNDMFTISAEGRGIALIQGGTFFAILDPKDPIAFWNAGAKHVQVSTKTFDAFQGKKQASTLDDATVNKLIDGLRR